MSDNSFSICNFSTGEAARQSLKSSSRHSSNAISRSVIMVWYLSSLRY